MAWQWRKGGTVGWPGKHARSHCQSVIAAIRDCKHSRPALRAPHARAQRGEGLRPGRWAGAATINRMYSPVTPDTSNSAPTSARSSGPLRMWAGMLLLLLLLLSSLLLTLSCLWIALAGAEKEGGGLIAAQLMRTLQPAHVERGGSTREVGCRRFTAVATQASHRRLRACGGSCAWNLHRGACRSACRLGAYTAYGRRLNCHTPSCPWPPPGPGARKQHQLSSPAGPQALWQACQRLNSSS